MGRGARCAMSIAAGRTGRGRRGLARWTGLQCLGSARRTRTDIRCHSRQWCEYLYHVSEAARLRPQGVACWEIGGREQHYRKGRPQSIRGPAPSVMDSVTMVQNRLLLPASRRTPRLPASLLRQRGISQFEIGFL